MAILRIAVYEETGKMIGQRVLPLDGLQAGYRHISLRTEGNFPLSLPTVFCEIILKSYVPDGLSDFVDKLNKPILAKKTEEALSASGLNASDNCLGASGSSMRANRLLTDSASVPNPTSDSRLTLCGASNSSVNTISTTDASSSVSKGKAPVDTIVPITLDYLRGQKNFMKLENKQNKETTLVRKKHAKEQNLLGEQQSKALSKLKSECEKLVRSPIAQGSSQRKDAR